MAMIPRTPGRGRIPTASGGQQIGGFVNASDLDGGASQNVSNLSNAAGAVGDALYQRGLRQTAALRREADLLYRHTVEEQASALFKTTGRDAFSAPDEMRKIQRVAAEAASKDMNPMIREMFDRDRAPYDLRMDLRANDHADKQTYQYNIQTIEAGMKKGLDDVAAFPGDGVQFINTIENGKNSIAELYAGSPAEYIAQKQQEYAEMAAEARANALLQDPDYGPQAALDFINGGIAEEIGSGALKVKFDQLRKRIEAAKENTDIAQAAMADVESGQYDSAALMRRGYELYPDDAKAAQMYINIADNYATRKRNAQTEAVVQKQTELWNAWAETGYDINKIPMDVVGDHTLFEKMINFGIKLDKAAGGGMKERSVPSYGALLGVSKMPMQERLAYLENPVNFERVMTQCGGDMDMYKRVANGTLPTYLNGGSGASDGSGSGRGSERFDLDAAFRNNFRIMRGNPGIGWVSDSAFDAKNEKHKSFYDNFVHHYNLRMRDKEGYPGTSPEKRSEDVFYDLIRDINNKPGFDMSKPTHEQFMQKQDTPLTVGGTFSELTEAQQSLTGGVSIPMTAREDAVSGTIVKLGALDVNSTDDDIGVTEDLFNARPQEALIAFDRGTISIYGQEATVEPGWTVATMPSGMVRIYDTANAPVGDPILPPVTDTAAPTPPSSLERYPEPEYQSEAMKRAVRRAKERYGEDSGDVRWEWDDIMGQWDLVTPNGISHWTKNGSPAGGTTF